MAVVDYDVAMEIACHEAVIRQAYKDGAGVWTWSVGLTSATGHDVKRYIGKPQNLQKCMDIYAWALKNYAEQVQEVFAGHDLTQAEFAAALSFHWNTGAIKRADWVDHFKAGRTISAEKSFKTWRKSGGKVVEGLVLRRKKEADLLFRGKWSHRGTMTEYSRLTRWSTPDWDSATLVNVEKELRAAMSQIVPPVIDHESQPEKEPELPTVTPVDYHAKLEVLGYPTVLEFQKNHPHLVNDGILGPETKKQIDADSEAKKEAPGVGGAAVVGFGLAAWLAANGHVFGYILGAAALGLVAWFVIRRKDEITHWIKNFRDN